MTQSQGFSTSLASAIFGLMLFSNFYHMQFLCKVIQALIMSSNDILSVFLCKLFVSLLQVSEFEEIYS